MKSTDLVRMASESRAHDPTLRCVMVVEAGKMGEVACLLEGVEARDVVLAQIEGGISPQAHLVVVPAGGHTTGLRIDLALINVDPSEWADWLTTHVRSRLTRRAAFVDVSRLEEVRQ